MEEGIIRERELMLVDKIIFKRKRDCLWEGGVQGSRGDTGGVGEGVEGYWGDIIKRDVKGDGK